MKTLTLIIVALFLTIPTFADAEESLTIGGGFDQNGCIISNTEVESTTTIFASYKRSSDLFDVHGYVKRAPRGADCREDGITVDIGIDRKFNLPHNAFALIELGYDQHGVTGFDMYNTLVFGSVKQETGNVAVGTGGANWDISLGWNIPTNEPRVALNYTFNNLEFSADESGGFSNISLSFVADITDKIGLRSTLRHSSGFDKLPDPFSGRADAPATNEATTLEFGLNWSL